jgi:hypothetical protein
VRKPTAWPCWMKNAQSSAVWFQPAPADSTRPPATSAGSRDQRQRFRSRHRGPRTWSAC